MLRSTFVLTVVLSTMVLGVSESSFAKPLLTKSAAQSKAREVLVTKAKDHDVKVRTADARATCTEHKRYPNTFACLLSERHKRCEGSAEVYVQGAVKVPKARSIEVRCTKKR